MPKFETMLSVSMLFISMLLAGCGQSETPPTLVLATGDVLYKNTPVTAGSIIFHPLAGNEYTKDNPSSLLQLDGSFSMKTFPFGEGVAPGKYKVTLAPEVAARLQKPEYANPDTTPWEVEVPEEGLDGHKFEVQDTTAPAS